ncbi:MBL fold metallo-hydrolase [Cognatazoarcus halotolerans]|uniref:MBL fold metallo-hydrolase n=1 Tax=Cognatazoarcus halotolerans TaxID=2686016 RepID=UPI0013578819|nr:MBL fold metallo-hydrolase [Cognatazoarcus halotolerans]MBX3680109.1 MBL fold metallo-hydrolase [Rhodocyclaceae bacterium]MCB1899032.1 MBL fold metallo-hydrolase [Rhodocyclaceae bacterium]MCP5308050.1 MBL fold metallo-hydrolase [Zoogloeaceae bacterium]
MKELRTHPDGIHALDSGYGRPLLDAIHLVEHSGRVAVIDTGTNDSVPRVMEALAYLGLSVSAVDFVMLTHIHLDHAGGAGALMRACPEARLVVHPRGARHMADPSKLWAGSVAVYGEETARRLYGEIIPVAQERIIEAVDGCVIEMGGRRFEFLDTPGHARHHVCIFDHGARAFFTGDTFGLSYRELDVDGRPSVFPTTTPVQFDPQAMHASIDRLVAYQPTAMYLTHYSRVTEVPRLAADLHRLIDAHVAIAEAAVGEGVDRHRRIRAGLEALVDDECLRQGWPLDGAALRTLLEMDIELNAQGLGVWLDSR